ncbi:NAD-P-binding protein [Pilatotrama ljubarskyi]|nr:NAD-P-binding protein [Pilatotrama ljubarskyi]
MSSIPQKTREYHLPKVDGFHNLTLTESPIPKLKSTEVLVKVHAVSLQYRDLTVAWGTYPLGDLKENLIPCSDLAGEIVALGDEVNGWNVGDRVCSNFATDQIFGEATEENKGTGLGGPIDGVLTEYKVLPAHALVSFPEHLSYEEASTLPCAAVTAYNALLGPIPLKGGDTVLVQGTGGVSVFALQLAVALGATVIATSSSDQKLEIAKKLGAAHTINYNTTPDWDVEVLKITHGKGVDRVVEIGGSGTIIKSMNCVRFGGNGQADVSELPVKVISKAVIMRGILIGSRHQFEDLNRLIAARKLRPVIDKVFSFEEVRKAYEYQASQRHVGKVVIKFSRD